jgi:four helix bundle protein
MTSQLRRSSSSIMANIAEGNYRKTNKDRLNFFITSRASLAETDCFLELAYDLKYLEKADYEQLLINSTKQHF